MVKRVQANRTGLGGLNRRGFDDAEVAEELLAAMEERNAEARLRVVGALDRLGAREATPDLIALLQDGNATVRLQAARRAQTTAGVAGVRPDRALARAAGAAMGDRREASVAAEVRPADVASEDLRLTRFVGENLE